MVRGFTGSRVCGMDRTETAEEVAWIPGDKPFMTVELTFAAESGGTQYSARVRHATIADREAHEEMGFHQGWALCVGQLAALVEG